ADVVITGEGRLDFQTAQGKAPSGVAKLAKKLNPNVLTVGIGGSVADISDDAGLDAVFPILREPMTLETAMKKNIAAKNISATVKQIIRLIKSVNLPCA
ncbi:MAG: glycerate kinase, partial [Selenomonadaceae bacterium]|nr:glycerate kinase [Selenomonadaceae bacterium]